MEHNEQARRIGAWIEGSSRRRTNTRYKSPNCLFIMHHPCSRNYNLVSVPPPLHSTLSIPSSILRPQHLFDMSTWKRLRRRSWGAAVDNWSFLVVRDRFTLSRATGDAGGSGGAEAAEVDVGATSEVKWATRQQPLPRSSLSCLPRRPFLSLSSCLFLVSFSYCYRSCVFAQTFPSMPPTLHPCFLGISAVFPLYPNP